MSKASFTPAEQAILKAAARIMGQRGGLIRSQRKKKAVRANGRLGGRPRMYPPCPKRYNGKKAHRFSKSGRCPCGYQR